MRAWSILLLPCLAACVNPGYVRFGAPRVHDSETTRALLKTGGALIAKEVRAADAGSVQEFFAARELTAVTGRAAAAGAPAAGGPAPVPTLPEAAGAGALPDLPPGDLVFGRTVPDQANDLRHREARAVEIELLYDGRGNARLLDPKARVYLVSFEIGLFPSRQSRWLYPVYWAQSLLFDHYDFTRGWFANVDFQIPVLAKENEPGGRPLVEIYDVMPRYDVLTAREAASNAQQLQLIAAAAAEGGAAQIDYLRRLEEQFAQQRRYPLQLGMIEHEKAWSWAFGTRRQLRRRSPLVAWIPFVGRYAAESRLEPGMRTAHAILLVPNYEELCTAPTSTAESKPEPETQPLVGIDGLRWKNYYDTKHRLDSVRLGAAVECAEGVATLPVLVHASYMKLDQPTRRVPLPISSWTPCDGKERCEVSRDARLVNIELNLDSGPASTAEPKHVASLAIEPAGGNRALVTIAIDDGQNAELRKRKVRRLEVRDETRKRLLGVGPLEVFDDQTLSAIVELPSKPPGDTIQLSARLVTSTDEFRTRGSHPYTGPWHSVPGGTIRLIPDSGGTGTQVRFEVSPDLRRATELPVDAGDVSQVLFGSVPIPRGSHNWFVPPNEESFSFMVPPPPKGARTVDVIVHFGNGRPPFSVGTFTYR